MNKRIELFKEQMTETRTFRTPGMYKEDEEEYPFDIVETEYAGYSPFQTIPYVDYVDGAPENWAEIQKEIIKEFKKV